MANHSNLRTRLLTAIDNRAYRAVHFTDPEQVPVGSTGYFSPSGMRGSRHHDVWAIDNPTRSLQETEEFVSTSGPAN